MIGSLEGVIKAVNSIAISKNYVCSAVITNDYIARNFTHYFFHNKAVSKPRILINALKAYRYVRRLGNNPLRKVPAVYFTPSEPSSELLARIPEHVFGSADIFLLACDDYASLHHECKTSDYVFALMRHGVGKDKMFVVPHEMSNAGLPVITGENLSPLCRKLSDVKPVLRYMEYHVTDFCNLKCKGCGHLANHVKTLEFFGADSFRLSLEKLREKFENIITLRIMGGEPLLCSELHEYINAAHEVFPYAKIKIVTNALLYRNITPLTVEAMRNAGAEFNVSQYPPTREIASEFIAFCQENGLRAVISRPVTKFFRRFVSGHDTDCGKIWYSCESKYCHFLHGTTFYPCPGFWTHSEPKFREILGKYAFTESEYSEYAYDLSKEVNDDGWDILRKFENPFELCKKCGDKKELFTWESEAGK